MILALILFAVTYVLMLRMQQYLSLIHIFLKLLDYTPAEIEELLDLAADLQAKKKAGIRPNDQLAGKNIALIFEKTSTRTRCSFEGAAHDLGMEVTYLDPSGCLLYTSRCV